MFKAIFTATLVATFLALSATVAFAENELNQDAKNANYTPTLANGGLIVRVNSQTGEVATAKVDQPVVGREAAEKVARLSQFVVSNQVKNVNKPQDANELNNDIGSEQTGNFRYYSGFHYGPSFAFVDIAVAPQFSYYYYNPVPTYYAQPVVTQDFNCWSSGVSGYYYSTWQAPVIFPPTYYYGGYSGVPFVNYSVGYRGGYYVGGRVGFGGGNYGRGYSLGRGGLRR